MNWGTPADGQPIFAVTPSGLWNLGLLRPALTPRQGAVTAFVLLFLGLLLLCRRLAPRCRHPGVLWGVGLYYLCLLAVFAYGLASSTHFETAFAQLTMLTFPLSILTDHTLDQEGFATAGGIAHNFVRYVLVYGGVNGVILAGFSRIVSPARPGWH